MGNAYSGSSNFSDDYLQSQYDSASVQSDNSGGSTSSQPSRARHAKQPSISDPRKMFHPVTISTYVLPENSLEQDRLNLEHILYTYGFGKLFHMPIHDTLNKGGTVLDSGCGSCPWSRDVAKSYPNSRVIGLDVSRVMLEKVTLLPNMAFVLGNLMERLPFENNSFDAVYQRNLCFGIPKKRWPSLLLEYKRVIKPGGYIELVESASRFNDAGTYIQKIQKAFEKSALTNGLDLDICLKLVDLLMEAGFQIVEENIHSAPYGWGGQLGELQKINMETALKGVAPMMQNSLKMSEEEYKTLSENCLKECGERKSYLNIFSVVARVPVD